MNIVITGGSGQLGTTLLRRLAADRSVKNVLCLDLRPPVVVSPKLQYRKVDVRDPEIRGHLAGADAVLHFAALVTQAAARSTMSSVNVEGSKNVLRAAAAEGVKTAVYTSSIAAYGVFDDHPQPIVESTPRRFHSAFAYAATKFEVEAFLDEFEPSHPEMSICRLRPAILLGAHMEHALGAALAARVLPDIGGPPMPVVWDEDAADAAILAMKKRARGAFNLAAEAPISSAEFAAIAGVRRVRVPRSLVRGLARLPTSISRVPPADPAWLDVADAPMVISSEKARTELGWTPRYGTTTEVAKRVGEVMRGGLDPRIGVFFRLVSAAAQRMPPLPEAASMNARIHLNLTGRGGGDVGLILEGGRLAAEIDVIPRPLTTVISMKVSLLRELLAGDASYATAQLTGKIRVEGEPMAALALSSIIATFRAQASRPSPQGWATRQLSRWITGSAGSP